MPLYGNLEHATSWAGADLLWIVSMGSSSYSSRNLLSGFCSHLLLYLVDSVHYGGDISGAHLNPAVTMAVVASGRKLCCGLTGVAYAATQYLRCYSRCPPYVWHYVALRMYVPVYIHINASINL